MSLRGKMQAYAEARAEGLDGRAAALHAGYESAGIAVTVSRLESRADIKAEVRRLQRGGKPTERAEMAAMMGVDEGGREGWQMKDRYKTPLDLLEDVWNNPKAPKSLRYQAAKDALPYCHARKEGGKKEAEREAAKEATTKGRFRQGARPSHLKAVG